MDVELHRTLPNPMPLNEMLDNWVALSRDGLVLTNYNMTSQIRICQCGFSQAGLCKFWIICCKMRCLSRQRGRQ